MLAVIDKALAGKVFTTAQSNMGRGQRRMKRVLYPKNMGRRVRILREDLGLSQQDFAEAVSKNHGISFTQSYLSRLEAGRPPFPNGAVTIALAKELNTTTDFLLCLIDDPDARPISEDQERAETTAISTEAEEAAKIIDALLPPMRAEALKVVKSLYDAEAARRTSAAMEFRQLLALVEKVAGVAARDQVEQAVLASSLEIARNRVSN